MNPLTLGFYPPTVPKPPHASHDDYNPAPPAEREATGEQLSQAGQEADSFGALDKRFRRALPDAWYFRRAAYRMAVLVAGPRVVRLDGVECAGERGRVKGVYEKMVARREGSG